MELVGGEGWEISVLDGWTAVDEGECISIVKSDNGGAITISALIDEDEDISQDELEIYGRSKLPAGAKLKKQTIGEFAGFTTEYTDEQEIYWLHSWLAFQDLLVYFSYNGDPAAWEVEKEDVRKILVTLQVESEHE